MDDAGDNLLADAGFTVDHHIGGIAGHLQRLPQSGFGLAAAEDIAVGVCNVGIVPCFAVLLMLHEHMVPPCLAKLLLDRLLHLWEAAQQTQGILGMPLHKSGIGDDVYLLADPLCRQPGELIVAPKGGKVKNAPGLDRHQSGNLRVD